ncbi:PREDICTED: short integuments 2, mitochondrial-like isoform X1 [Nicotiana attenuata]|uniref:Short integuments 2, mitochondrial n=1 Tax=Nicotiana attenuata TaxID=49451 RepID=A0A314KHU9_NICAT|nr:PREDICTED: short integuments 2, mitochondrial-like isoform X1 [Nicotiana attenuata]OIT28464.1 short integuments 2, mitochondrial [Nicotiana attenuata]
MGAVRKGWLGQMGFNKGGGNINWFPGHMAAATRAIRQRLKLSDLVIEVRDARIPLSSANEDLQPLLSGKRRVIALNKQDLANRNLMHGWISYFNSCKQECLPINAHSRSSVQKLLDLVEFKLKEVMTREPTLLVMVLGVPNVGKSALINSIHQIALSRFPVQEKRKKARVGPLPGVTQDIAGFKIAHRPSVYVLDTPGVLVPSIPDIETGLKLALAGSVKDSVVGEERIAQYLLAVLNTRGTPLHWKHLVGRDTEDLHLELDKKLESKIKDLLNKSKKPINKSDVYRVQDMVSEVQRTLYITHSEFNGSLEDENDLETLIDHQFEALQKALKIPHKASEARIMVSKKFLTLFRTGKLGSFILDDVPDASDSVS